MTATHKSRSPSPVPAHSDAGQAHDALGQRSRGAAAGPSDIHPGRVPAGAARPPPLNTRPSPARPMEQRSRDGPAFLYATALPLLEAHRCTAHPASQIQALVAPACACRGCGAAVNDVRSDG